MLAQHAASASHPYIGVSNSTHGVNTNTSLDNYFVFRPNGGTTTGQFTTLTITDGLGDTLSATILYGDGRFTDPGIGDVTLTADGLNGDSTSFNDIAGGTPRNLQSATPATSRQIPPRVVRTSC